MKFSLLFGIALAALSRTARSEDDVDRALALIHQCPGIHRFAFISPSSVAASDLFKQVLHYLRILASVDTHTLKRAVAQLTEYRRYGSEAQQKYFAEHGMDWKKQAIMDPAALDLHLVIERDYGKIVFLTRCLFVCPRAMRIGYAEMGSPYLGGRLCDFLWPIGIDRTGRFVMVGQPYHGIQIGADIDETFVFDYAAEHWKRRRWRPNSDRPIDLWPQ